jgi:hypothetical protein
MNKDALDNYRAEVKDGQSDRPSFDLSSLVAFTPAPWVEVDPDTFELLTEEFKIVIARTRFNRHAAFVYIRHVELTDDESSVLWMHKETLDWREALTCVIRGIRSSLSGIPETDGKSYKIKDRTTGDFSEISEK